MSTVSLEEFLKPISHALGRTEVPTSVTPCAATKAPLPTITANTPPKNLPAGLFAKQKKLAR